MQHIAEFFEQGGFFMYVNVFCSVVAIGFIVERALFFINRGGVNAEVVPGADPRQLHRGQQRRPRDQDVVGVERAPLARVAKAGLERSCR